VLAPFLVVNEVELKYRLRFRMLDVLASVVQLGIPWGALCFIAYMVFRSVGTLAGRATVADLRTTFLGNVKINEAVAWVLVALFGAYGLNERRLRRKHIERTAPTIHELEAQIDPNRTSSRLSQRGTTRREDRP
jgi:hypothetical protein